MKTPKKLFTAGAIGAFSLGLVTGVTAQQQQTPGQTDRPGQTQQAQPGQPGQQQQHGQQQQAQQPGMGQEQQQAGQQSHRWEDLSGTEVTNQEGERLGTLEDVAVKLEDGRLAFAIVSEGGFLGIGGDWRPVPPEALEIRGQDDDLEIVLNISESEWENAPTIDREQIDQLAQEQRAQEIYSFYGEDWQQAQQRQTEFGAPGERDRDEGIRLDDNQHERDDDDTEFGARDRDDKEKDNGEYGARAHDRKDKDKNGEYGARERDDDNGMEFGAPGDRDDQDRAIREDDDNDLQAEGLDQDRDQTEFGSPEHRQEGAAGVGAQQQQDQERTEALGQEDDDTEFGARQQQHGQAGVGQQQQAQVGQQQQQEGQIRLASDVTDFEIVNQQDEEIGRISDLLVNLEEGRVDFVVFTEGTGMMDMMGGGDEYVVSPRALQRIQDDRAVLNIRQQDLEQAQALTRQQLPQQAQQQARAGAESPQVFRFQDDDDTGIFGDPDRDRDDARTEDRDRDDQDQMGARPQEAPTQQERPGRDTHQQQQEPDLQTDL